jgi:hypothetical protein
LARKRKKKSNTIFKRKGARRKPRSFELGPGLKPIFTVIVIVFLLAGIVVGFFYLEKYVRTVAAVSENIGTLELVNPPGWVNEALK